MVPERHHGLAADQGRENLRHADGERRRAASTRDDGVLAHILGGLIDLLRRNREPPFADLCGSASRGRANLSAGRIHREVDARLDDAGRDQRHDGDERLHEHAAVADKAGVRLGVDQLRRRAGRDQGVEARHRAAGDGDEQEREQRARPDRARPSTKRVTAGIFRSGATNRMPSARALMAPIFRKVER